jgi:hypothetical protein
VADLAEFDLEGKEYLAYSGSGTTSLTPKYCWLRSGAMVDENMMKNLFSETEENVLFVRFRLTQGDANDGAVKEEYGVKLMRLVVSGAEGTTSYTYRFSFFNPNVQVETGPVDPGVEWNSGFTAAEIASMRAAKKEEIKNLEFQIKMEEAEFKIMQKEADSGEVVAEFDGTVVALLDPEMAQMTGSPVLKVSGGGGFYIEGSVSELERKKLKIGQEVTINDWRNGGTYTGEVVSIGDFPSDSDNWNGMGNPTASYYPFKAFVSEDADLQAGSHVSMSYSTASAEQGIYLEKPFVRTEKGKSYIYVRGSDGRLEKRDVKVGKVLWGSYYEILSPLGEEDCLAFPYGKNVKPGAPTVESDLSALYGY